MDVHGTSDRKSTVWELAYAGLSGFVLGFVIASTILVLFYFGIIWKVNRHE